MPKSVVVVTGASAGIGAAIARRFAKEGHLVAALARRNDKLLSLQKEFPSHILPFPLDITKPLAVAETFSTIENSWGPIAVLVNNAGLARGLDPAFRAQLKNWEEMVQTNIQGILYTTHAVLPRMVERNQGHILQLGSIAGTYPYPGGNVYGATKAFLRQFSLNLRADLLGTAVRVTCIEPGLVGGSEFSLVRFQGDAAKADSVYQGTEPLHPEDIANIAYFCHALPPHVNINSLEVMPTSQAYGPLPVHKKIAH